MKKKNYLIMPVVLALLGLGSCSDEDNGKENSNCQLRVYGLQYTLETGVVWKSNKNVTLIKEPYVFYDIYTDDNGNEQHDKVEGFAYGSEEVETGNFMLSLYADGLTFMPEIEGVAGKGACICFHLASPDVERFVPGKYVYHPDKMVNTFSAYSSVLYDTQTTGYPATIVEGEINIEENDGIYRIEFEGATNKKSKVSCQYEGPLKECQVKQQAAVSYQDITIAGLFDSLIYIVVATNKPEWIYDTDCGAFFNSSTGKTSYASSSGKDKIDVALFWEKETASFVFESPIRMRKWLGHSDDYNFPCHTVYMKAPDTFTDEDFEKLEETGFSFEFQEEEVKINTNSFQPCYVFFRAGNGTQGVIRVKSFVPLSSYTNSYATIPINPALVVDVKCPAKFVNPEIR